MRDYRDSPCPNDNLPVEFYLFHVLLDVSPIWGADKNFSHNIVLLMEILCGERVSVTNMKVRQEEEIYKYLGQPIMPKERLHHYHCASSVDIILWKVLLFLYLHYSFQIL